MIDTFDSPAKPLSTRSQINRATTIRFIWLLSVIGGTALLAVFILYRRAFDPALLGWLLFFCGGALIIYKPRYGIYLCIFLALIADNLLLDWYPFVKNFSSPESIFYLHNAVIISPLEIYLGLTLVSWLGRSSMRRDMHFFSGQLLWPVLVFTSFIAFGLFYGVSRGGSINIALWETRPIYYLPVMLILCSNLLTKRAHVSNLLWVIMAAIFVEGLVGTQFYFVVLNRDLSMVDRITEHSAAVHMNTFFVFVITIWIFRGSLSKRFFLLLLLPPILLTYLVTQRRAAFVALIIAFILIAIILFSENRTTFYLIVPPLFLIGAIYVAAFWNSYGALAMPAQAVKSVIAEDQANESDQRSNLYRQIENVNSHYTIRKATLTGVGFGNKFYVLVPLPDISFFVWWEYITHNSIIWIWMKAGIGGFLAMLFFIGMTIMVGMRAFWRTQDNELRAIALTAVIYVIMHFIYAYVDMSWDSQSMLYLGAMIGILNGLEHIMAQPVKQSAKRWPWQPDPQPVPGLLPLPGN